MNDRPPCGVRTVTTESLTRWLRHGIIDSDKGHTLIYLILTALVVVPFLDAQ